MIRTLSDFGDDETPKFLLSVYGPAERNELGDYLLEAFEDTGAFNDRLAAEGSKACRGKVEVRPFQTEDSVKELLDS